MRKMSESCWMKNPYTKIAIQKCGKCTCSLNHTWLMKQLIIKVLNQDNNECRILYKNDIKQKNNQTLVSGEWRIPRKT